MNTLPDLSVIILSWNVAKLLEACLRSLPPALGEWAERAEVVVVDNASTDNSAQMVRSSFPDVRLLQLGRNLGFAAGNNAGIRASLGKYIFLLNPDTVAHPGSIALLAGYIKEHQDVGVAGPRLRNPDGTLQPSRRRFPTLATALIESTPLQRRLPNAPSLRSFYMLDRPDNATQEVDWVSGAALMCRREALEQAGLLDPGYFMFSEEVDLCRRITHAGWRVVYLPGAAITHYGGQSTGQDIPARHIRFNTSKVRYFRLHEGRIAGEVVRRYLLFVYALQAVSDRLKWLAGHKRPLRRERILLYRRVVESGLRQRPTRPRDGERVLLVTGEYPPAQGGVGDYTCKLHLALQEEGISAKVLTRTRCDHFGATRRPGTGGVPPIPRTQNPTPGRSGATPGRDIACVVPTVTLSAVRRAARGVRANIVHIQYQTGAYEMRPTVNLLPLLLRRSWRGATVVTFHDLLAPYLFPRAGRVREWANRLLARSASFTVATNPEDVARLASWGVKRVKLIPIGSNIPDTPPTGYDRRAWRIERGISDDTTLLAYFGFLNSSKGLGDLLCALSALKEKGSYRLLMLGGGLGSSDPTNRATADALVRQAQELDVQERLVWTGYLDAQGVSAALLSADIAVLPYADGASFRRGSLLAVLEHGLPVITTTPRVSEKFRARSTGWPALSDGKNALLVSPGDTFALVESIARLASDAHLRAELARGAKELARFFSWVRIARMHAALYREILGRAE